MIQVNIRKAVSTDMRAVLELVRELAVYEKAPDAVTADLDLYARSFAEGLFEALVAETDAGIVGTAIFYPRFSTWKGPMLHLEDFIVKRALRGQGIGTALFDRFLETARERDAKMVIFQVLNWNTPAMNFYDKYDVVYDKEWIDAKIYF